MSRNQKETFIRSICATIRSICAALSTTGGYIAVALTLVIVAVIASIFHVNWSERVALVGLAILFNLIMGRRGSSAV